MYSTWNNIFFSENNYFFNHYINKKMYFSIFPRKSLDTFSIFRKVIDSSLYPESLHSKVLFFRFARNHENHTSIIFFSNQHAYIWTLYQHGFNVHNFLNHFRHFPFTKYISKLYWKIRSQITLTYKKKSTQTDVSFQRYKRMNLLFLWLFYKKILLVVNKKKFEYTLFL